VLRIPDTFHRKTNTPIPVKLVRLGDDYSLECITKCLGPFKVAMPKTAPLPVEDPSLFMAGPSQKFAGQPVDLVSANIPQNKAQPVHLDGKARLG
jgi:hypothetical protein